MASPRDRVERLLSGDDTFEHADTLPRNPGETIVPTRRLTDEAAEDALSMLAHLITRGGHRVESRFELGVILGQGGMGTVRLAKQIALGRDVVVKTLRPDKRSPQATAELLQEAWVTGALEHPSVVPVYELGVDGDGDPAIVFKRVEGVTWSALMQDAAEVELRFGSNELLEWNLRILMQVINAVRFAHNRGIVHRDLKPDNVMIGEFGEVYIVDWGIAVSLRDDGPGRLPRARDASNLAGTPCYMAPEMLGGAAPEISERTDIYLLGAILYEILAGKPPHDGESPLDVFTSVVESKPSLPLSTPPGLAWICRRAMAAEPDKRFGSAVEMHRALQDFLQHRGSEALARQAETRLSEIRRLLRQDTSADSRELHHDHRQQLYKHYGACRFGFLEALSAWRDNPIARRGLGAATEAMIEYELEQGDARAAAALMAEIAGAVELSDGLRERVDEALEARAADEARVAELERLGHELDIRVGARTRAWATLLMGVAWIALPFLGGLLRPISASYPDNTRMALWSTSTIVPYLIVLYLVRKSLFQSAINRRLATLIGVMLAGQAVLHLGAEVAGLAPVAAQTFQFFMWFGVLTVMAVTIERRIVPSALGYLAAYFAVAVAPDWRFLGMAAANLVVLVNALVIWMPRGRSDGRHPALPRGRARPPSR